MVLHAAAACPRRRHYWQFQPLSSCIDVMSTQAVAAAVTVCRYRLRSATVGESKANDGNLAALIRVET